jgi:hypothetical protein
MDSMRKKTTLVPTTPLARRFHAIFHRQEGTAWSEREIRAYKDLVSTGAVKIQGLELVERWYRSCWPPKSQKNTLRHNLLTLLLNWPGEVDKARIWCGEHALKADRTKIITMPATKSDEPWVAPTDPEEQAKLQRFLDAMAERGSKGCQQLRNELNQEKLNFGDA